MNATRDFNSPRYFVCLLTRWHPGARACQSLINLRKSANIRIRNPLILVKILSFLLIIWWSTSEKWISLSELFSSSFQWNSFEPSLETRFLNMLSSSVLTFMIKNRKMLVKLNICKENSLIKLQLMLKTSNVLYFGENQVLPKMYDF